MSDALVFEEPPERVPGKHFVIDRLRPLRDRPGEWARVYGPSKNRANCYNFASGLRTGHHSGISEGEFDAKAGEKDGQWFVWARYIGNGSGT